MKRLLLILFVSVILFFASCAPRFIKEIPEPVPKVKVLLGTINTQDELAFKDHYFLIAEEARYEFGTNNQSLTVEPLVNGIRLFNNSRNLLYRNTFPVILEPKDESGHFIFRGSEYEGSILFQPASDSALFIINEISLEDYLKGVVPAEIFATQEEFYQAVKAQAICARTYAMLKMNKNKNNLYHLQNTIADQVYSGFEKHRPLSDKAIQETSGIVITHNNNLVQVYYHSTCGGQLEAAENVWPEQKYPHLMGGVDAVGEIYSCSNSPFFRWIEKRNIQQLDSAFNQYYNKSLIKESPQDTLNLQFGIDVLQRYASGRVKEIQLVYADTSVSLTGYEIRRFFALPPNKYLKSNLFYFTQPNDSTLEIHGAGNGHGVGMCQFGAMNMSSRGFLYYHILSKYYPHTVLTRKY